MTKTKVDNVELTETIRGIKMQAYKDEEFIFGALFPNQIQAMLYIGEHFELPDESS